jgi:hypothetical protein
MAATDMAPGAPLNRVVQRLSPDDAEALCPLCIEAGWNQVAADWRLMLQIGGGYGVRGTDGRWIASALSLPIGPSIAWLGMVLVTGPERRKGLGGLLLSRCIADVERAGLDAGLDATELGRPIYLPLGFRDVYPLSRWQAAPGPRRAVEAPEGIAIRPVALGDLSRICDYDRTRSGFERGPILAHLFTRAGDNARIAARADGALAGYVLARDGYRGLHVGPVVAEDEAIGLALLSSVLAATSGAIIADIPDRHAMIRRWLTEQGASAPRGFMRMVRGKGWHAGDAAHVFALAGPELA